MTPINILHINHISRTWSGNVIKNIIQLLPKDEFHSHILVWYDFDNSPNTDSLYKTSKSIFYRQIRYKFWVWINFLLDFMSPWCITFKYLKSYSPYQKADIIHIHCPQWWYFDWNDLPSICNEKKVIMTIHDDWITSWNDSENLYYPYKSKSQFNKRYSVFSQCNITYVWVSRWCTNKTKKCWITVKNWIQTIYNWINTNVFTTADKVVIRNKLDIPLHKKVIISLAGSWSKTNMKWLWYTNKILALYSENHDFLFITLWNSWTKKISNTLREVWYVDQQTVAHYFQSADMFLYPTLMDSFWLIIAESIACWCPVVTFNIGWVPEVVSHKINWYVAKYKDLDDLHNGFKWILKNKSVLSIELNKVFSQQKMVAEYADLYKSLLDKKES